MAISFFKKPLSVLLKDVYEKYGTFIFLETAYHYDATKKDILLRWIDTVTINDPLLNKFDTIHKFDTIQSIDKTDGLKLYFSDTNWALFRLSGTEPVIRIYVESTSSRISTILLDCSNTVLNCLFNQ